MHTFPRPLHPLPCHLPFAAADDFFAKQLPHNVTWLLTLLFALDQTGDFGDTAVQGRLVHQLRYLASVVTQNFSAFGELLAMPKRFAEISGGWVGGVGGRTGQHWQAAACRRSSRIACWHGGRAGRAAPVGMCSIRMCHPCIAVWQTGLQCSPSTRLPTVLCYAVLCCAAVCRRHHPGE